MTQRNDILIILQRDTFLNKLQTGLNLLEKMESTTTPKVLTQLNRMVFPTIINWNSPFLMTQQQKKFIFAYPFCLHKGCLMVFFIFIQIL